MGGMLSVPLPSKVKPKPSATTSGQKAGDQNDLKDEARQKARRGRASNIATSPAGLLALADWASSRKSLLGE
jgi:hypothetical protein